LATMMEEILATIDEKKPNRRDRLIEWPSEMVLLWWFSLQLVLLRYGPLLPSWFGASRLAPFLGVRKKPCRREGTSIFLSKGCHCCRRRIRGSRM
jgi:hypothetical protein